MKIILIIKFIDKLSTLTWNRRALFETEVWMQISYDLQCFSIPLDALVPRQFDEKCHPRPV